MPEACVAGRDPATARAPENIVRTARTVQPLFHIAPGARDPKNGAIDVNTGMPYLWLMKTTIDVRDDVLRRAKARAALRGEPLSRFIEVSIERSLREEEPDSSSWADWALSLPPVLSESIVELNEALSGSDFRPIDPEMWR